MIQRFVQPPSLEAPISRWCVHYYSTQDLDRDDIDGAILDVNLGGDMVYPVADVLIARKIPFVLSPGYDQASIPTRFEKIVRCDKPVNLVAVTRAIGRLASN